jgi:hypothetical protein
MSDHAFFVAARMGVVNMWLRSLPNKALTIKA